MNVRKLALDTINKCESSGGYSNLALDATIKKFNISGDDRSLFTVLVYGTIEHKLTLDYYIGQLSSLTDSKIEPVTRNILRLGLYQIIFMRVATHAAVNETVALAPQKSRGFVNAILRNYLRKKDSIKLPERQDGEALALSVKFSYPADTCERLCSVFGYEETEKLLSAFDSPPPLTLRVNTLKISRDEFLKRLENNGISAEATRFAPFGVKLRQNISYTELDALAGGLFFVQDEASQIAIAALEPSAGELLMDICACPGSKSFGAAISMQNNGTLLAYDLSKSKLPLIKSGAERLGIDIIRSEVHDGRVLIEELCGKADRIICDVPCSGFGVFAKKPDIRYKDLKAVEALPDIQLDILRTASKYLKAGGVLLYSTCTILPEENEKNVLRFLAEHPEFELVPFNIGELECENGYITLLPHIHHTDGFFMAKLRRKDIF